MKRKILIFVILLAGTGLFVLQSCKKEGTIFGSHYSFTEPVVVAPENGATIDIHAETTVNLQWESTNASDDPVLADVYFGTSSNPPLYKADHNALTLNVPVVKGITYHWYVRMKDVNGIPTTSPTWSFTVFEPIGIFVGSFKCDEPAEAWNYTVHFTKTSDNTLGIDKYWASWASTFTLNFTANTYSMSLTDFGGGYSAIESGTINPATGTMVGTYTIYHPAPTIEETGTHTYTKN